MRHFSSIFSKVSILCLSILVVGSVFSSCTTETPPTRLDSFTVHFESNGGTVVDSQRVERGKLATQPVPPTKRDSIFSGWYSDASLSTVFQFSTPITQNTRLYAKWEYDDPYVTIPDSNFRKRLQALIPQAFNTEGRMNKLHDSVAKRTVLDIGNSGISNLSGIEYFTGLTSLGCYTNQLTALDVSRNTALTALYCSSNQLTALDVSRNTALTTLYCSSNQLTALDVSGNTALTDLSCSSNQLTALDVSGNTALTDLSCSSNQLTALDVSGNTALTALHCSSNQLTSLDISGMPSIISEYSSLDGFSGMASALSLVVNKAIETDSKIADLKTKYGTKLSVTVR